MITRPGFCGWTGRSGSKRAGCRSSRRASCARSSARSSGRPGAGGALRTLFSREYVEKVAVDGRHDVARARANWSATSGPTAPASRRRSRCSPASSCRPRARCASPGSCRTSSAQRERAQHRRRLRPAHAAVLGPAAGRIVRAAARDLRRPAPSATGATSTHFIEMLEMGEFMRHAGAPALARPAHARRFRGGDAARSADRLPRRADDRARRRRQGSDPRRSSPR